MSTDKIFTGHRRILSEFIKMYRSEPCLWLTKCADYRDRVSKDAAYERLVVKLKELDSTADRDKVVKKINSLRTNWRKEKKKFDESIGTARPYKPRLWYYHLFDFLDDYYSPDSVKYDEYEPMLETEDDEFIGSLEYEELQGEEPTEDAFIEEYDEPKSLKVASQKIIRENRSIAVSSPQPSCITKLTAATATNRTSTNNELLLKRTRSTDDDVNYDDDVDDGDEGQITTYDNYVAKRKRARLLQNVQQQQHEDRHEAFGRNVAMKLRHITDKTQRLLAEKLINDALFMAEFGELNMAHGVTSFNTQTQSQYETDYISEPISSEQYDAMAAANEQQVEEVQVVNKLSSTNPTSNRRLQELQEMSRSILRRI